MLLSYPHDSLKKKCIDVLSFDQELKDKLDAMHSILKEHSGAGLASNQCGFDGRFFLIKLKNEEILEVINPIIIEEVGQQYELEGCLSFNSISVQVQRPKYIHAKWQDRNGEYKEGVFSDREAICFSHENDHLDGKILLDRINRQSRKYIIKQMGL